MLTRLLGLFLALMQLGSGALGAYGDEMSLGGRLFLVNRDYALSADYVPDDLVKPDVKASSSAVLMRREAAGALEEMFAAAKAEGLSLVAVSGYRSYMTQKNIFARKVSNVGKQKALLYVAPPGTSEHQLGLAMDLGTNRSQSLNASFGSTKEGQWVREHCHEFGFIIRYREEWTEITGYAYEPWHVRYVGRPHAELIHEADIPLEYYIRELRSARYAQLTGEEMP